jgi:hypothetical protein
VWIRWWRCGRISTRRQPSLVNNRLYIGGETGIRNLYPLLESASCRFFVAPPAIFAIRPADHCTLLHAGRQGWRGALVRPPHRSPPRAHRACGACAAFSRSSALRCPHGVSRFRPDWRFDPCAEVAGTIHSEGRGSPGPAHYPKLLKCGLRLGSVE